MEQPSDLLARLRALNNQANFNRWCGFEVIDARVDGATLLLPWRDDFGQYSNFLHAGLVSALIDTACGFAAVSMVGGVLASHCAVNFLRPAVGKRFIAHARVVKPGKTQVFTSCELYGESGDDRRLVATGETILVVVPS